MSVHAQARPIGGRIFTTPFSAARGAVRRRGGPDPLSAGHRASGQITAMNDGYPWGLWIAFDVVTGHGARLRRVRGGAAGLRAEQGEVPPAGAARDSHERARLHAGGRRRRARRRPLVEHLARPAVRLALEPRLRPAGSRALHHGLHVRAVDRAVAGVPRAGRADRARRRSAASPRAPGRSSRSTLLWIIALGILLPTMHQSSLGALMLIAGPRLHPLWNTGWLPLLFLMSCIAMGYAIGRLRVGPLGLAAEERAGARDARRARRRRSCRSASSTSGSASTTWSVRGQFGRAVRVRSVQRAGADRARRWSCWRSSSCSATRGASGWRCCSAPRCCSCWPAASTASTPTWWRSGRARTGRTSRASPKSSSRSG